MLELKNICKTYRPKKGKPVQALKDISVKFDETGMVFILGKSGCGKSTLLNTIGGLDKFDSGEIVVMGKSSKEFSASDFDSYRNTLIGFIFQEYNILPEFTIAKNIALALELQGKKATKEKVQELLDQVDLGTQGNRKPNELSGGQKQRVAIARALIKEPQIIIADEPTGALDSATGKQVFDTLKKLSQEKLVIIVSHDREYAEIYADRIVEMKDGKIISDETKRFVEPKAVSSGIKLIGDNTLQIDKGTKLSKEQLEILSKFFENSTTDCLISTNEKSNAKFKEVSKISPNGNAQVFSDTKPEDFDGKVYDKTKLKFIKSKLRPKDSIKIGASGLKAKPIRLAFTILLSMVAFGLFGTADTLASYNAVGNTVATIEDNNVKVISFAREELYENAEDDYYYYSDGYFDAKSKKALEDATGQKTYYLLKTQNFSYGNNVRKRNGSGNAIVMGVYSGSYFSGEIEGVSVIDNDFLTKTGFKLLGSSHLPINNNEILVTKYFAEHFVGNDYYEEGTSTTYQIASLTDVIGKKLCYDSVTYTICGVLDTGLKQEDYSQMVEIGKGTSKERLEDYSLISNFEKALTSDLHGCAFISGEALNSLAGSKRTTKNNVSMYLQMGLDDKWVNNIINISSVSADDIEYVSGFGGTTLASNKYLIGAVAYYQKLTEEITDVDALPTEEQQYYWAFQNSSTRIALLTNSAFRTYLMAKFEADDAISVILNVSGSKKKGDIVGLYFGANGQEYAQYDYMIVTDSVTYDNLYVIPYDSCFMATPSTRAELEKVVKFNYSFEESDKKPEHYVLNNGILSSVLMANNLISTTKKALFYVSLFFAVFAGLMLSNFIAVSISYKKREIGILRAIGARKKDVFSIFFSESAIIALINFVLGTAFAYAATRIISNTVADAGLKVTLLVFTVRQVVLILGVSLIVAFLASLIPVLKISRKQPIDAINNR